MPRTRIYTDEERKARNNERVKKFYKKNKDKHRANAISYYNNNKEHVLQRQKARRIKMKEDLAQLKKLKEILNSY